MSRGVHIQYTFFCFVYPSQPTFRMRRRPENGDEMHGAYGSQARRGGRNDSGGYYPAPTDRIRETNHNIMEMQNNAHIDDLSDQVRIQNLVLTRAISGMSLSILQHSASLSARLTRSDERSQNSAVTSQVALGTELRTNFEFLSWFGIPGHNIRMEVQSGTGEWRYFAN